MKLELIPVIRYWEIPARDYSALFEQLPASGARAVAVWVPWSQLETDHQHLLQKFLRAAIQARMPVRLGITPEIGNGYWNAGVPSDLVNERVNWAQDRLGETIYSCSPPNIHPLVSLTAPAVFQRFGHFLLKLAQEVQEVLGERITAPIDFIVTDSFFKNYCNTGLPLEDHGDFSSRYSKGEVQRTVLSPMQAEQLFSQRALDFLNARFARFRQVKVQYQTVCSRSASLDRLLEELAQTGPNLPSLIETMQTKAATTQLLWLDDLSGLDDRARNFILSFGLLGFSESWCSWEDFLSLKPAFRQRAERLVQTFADTKAERYQPVIALVGNRYTPAFFPRAMQEHLGFSLKIVLAQADLNPFLADTKMLVVEEGLKLDFAQSKELLRYSRELGKTLVVFRSSLCERAQAEYAASRSFQLKHGWEFSISLFPSGGQALVVEGSRITAAEMRALALNLLTAAKIDPWCTFQAEGVSSIRVDWPRQSDENELRSIFLFNTEAKEKNIELVFSGTVKSGEGEGREIAVRLPPFAALPLHLELIEPEKNSVVTTQNSASQEYLEVVHGA